MRDFSYLFAYGLAFFLPFLVLVLTEQHKCRLGWLGWLLWGLRFRVSSLSFVAIIVAIIVGFIRAGFGRCWSKRRVLVLVGGVVVVMLLVMPILVVVVMMLIVMLIIRVWFALESKES